MRRKAGDTAGEEPRKWTCPYCSLPDIIDFAKIVRRVGGNSVAESQVLRKLKINTRVTRSWSYRLASAREFGLLDRTGRKEEARLLLTELCVRLLTSSDDRLEGARMSAFRRPRLYVELVDRYLGAPAPSVEDLASVLVRDFGLLDSVAERAAQAFLDSAQFAGVITVDGHVGSRGNGAQLEAPARPPQKTSEGDSPSGATDATLSTDGLITHRFQLRPDIEIVVRLPSDLNQSDVVRLYKWLQTLPFEDSED
jgi:hypothetical protein